MIVGVRCNKPSFKEVKFGPGLNVVLADRTKESTRRDSRNGLGKTTLVEVIHFCLGAPSRRGQGLMTPQLRGWEFTLDMRVQNREITVTRSTNDPNRVTVRGNVEDLIALTESQDDMFPLHVDEWNLHANEWNSILGELFFDLSLQTSVPQYNPTFRSLISYFIRRGRDGFSSPFVHHRAQREWDKQVHVAFLLGLAWEHASQLQEIKDEANLLNNLRRAAQAGLLEGMIGTPGNLEAERVRLELEVRRRSESLANFRVHPQYDEIEREANELTSEIQQLVNANVGDGRLVDLYRDSLEDDQTPHTDDVLNVYQAVGVVMPELVRRRLEEVEDFHRQILANRRDYLQSEIQRIATNRSQRQVQIQERVDRRGRLLGVLRTYGALREHTQLQELHLDLVARLNDINGRITNLRRFEQGRSEVRVKRELLLQTARRDFEERRDARERAIDIFNLNSQGLYDAPGNLVVDVADTGYNFDVEILRSGSQGINNMKIFCFDLMLAQLWATRRPSEGILVHDSTIFDGVDERQVAQALELAHKESEHWGFQYVCALNSDTLPSEDFSPGFSLGQFVRLRLTDESEEGGLLGVQY